MRQQSMSLRKKLALSSLIAGCLFGISPQSSQAGSATWNQTVAGTYDWGNIANWNPNTTFPNAATDVANINNNIAGAVTINLATGTAANRTVNDLNLGDSDNTHGFTIASGVATSTLIFAGTNPSLDVTSGNIANIISAPIQLQANTVFRSNGTAAQTISGVISNNGTVRNMTFNNDVNGTATAAGTNQGQFVLSAANTAGGATGTVAISDVRVQGSIAGAFGANAANTVTVSGAGQMYLTAGTHVNNLVLNSTGWAETAGNFGALRIESATVSGTVALTSTATIGVNANVTGTLSGVISGAGGITKVGGTATSGQGELLLSGTNTFTGPVTVNNGTIRVSNASGLGTNTTVTVNASPTAGGDGNRLAISGTISVGSGKTLALNSNGTGDFRSMLVNTANNNTWAGNIQAGGSGLVQVSAAANTTLTISGAVSSTGGGGTGTLFSRGAGNVIYNGVINLGSDRRFAKTDAGTVIVNSTGNSWLSTQAANGQIQIGANNALANVDFTFGETSANSGRLELNGFNQGVTRFITSATSTGTNHILRNSNLTTPSTLTFATPIATTDTLTNLQVQGTASGLGTLNLVSNGLGRTEFNNGLVSANSWTVNSGTLAFTGTNSRVLPGSVTGLAAATIEKAGASTTLAATSTWNNAGTTNITGGTLVLGAGTAGVVNVSDGATLSTGLGGGVLASSAVTFGTAGATTYVPLLTVPAVAAPLNAASLTTAGTTVTVAPQAGAFTTGTYRLLDYTGSIGGNGFGGFALAPVGSYPHITATLDNTTVGQVNLVVTAADSLIWAGQTSSVWDVNTTSNFALASSTSTGATFYQGDAVVFGDTHDVGTPATPVTNSTITGSAVTIGNLTFNNSAVTYSVANVLSGVGSITKTGTGSVTLSGANSYAGITSVSNGTLILSGANLLGGGVVNVTGGTLRIGNSDALRGAGAITVSGGGTFDANGIAVGTRYPAISFSGTGVGGNGAIINSGVAIVNNSHFTNYTMTGDATWGGSGRYDIVAGQTFNGGAFTLTKVGAGELWFNPNTGSVLENVIVNGGAFGSTGNNPLSATATVTVNNTGTHQFFGAVTGQHNVVLNDGGIFRQSNNTAATLTGQVTLNGTSAGRNIQAVTGGTMNIAGKITGTGGFTVNEAGGTVTLQNAANDYAGDTVITLGTLNFNATGIIPATTNLIVNGVAAPTTANSGTFATNNLPRSVASLSGTGGIISGGNILTTNQSTSTVWNGNLNGTTAQMSGTGSLTLGGTGDNSSGIAIVNSGTLIFAKGNTTPVAQAIHSVGGGVGVTVNGGTLQLGGTYDNTTPGTGVNAPPVGINTATYVDQIYNAVGVVLNAGTFDLNGRQEAINTLTNPVGVGGTVTNTAAATAAKLYIGHQNGTSIFGGAINDGTGTVAVEKIGTGTLTLTGASNFTGGLTATAGTVVFDGTITGTGPIAVNGTSLFAGAGTSGGTLTAATGTTVRVGTASAGTAATTLTLGGFTLTGGTNLNLDFNTAGTTVDKVATTATNGLSISGANPLNVVLSGAGWVPGTYPILTYAGAVQGTGATNATLVLSTPVGHSTVNVVDNLLGSVNLVVAGAANKWVGNVNNTWDTNTTLNWNAVDNLFLTGDSVVFDDTATTYTPNILANQTPAGVTFDNTTAYTLSSTGAFGIAGTGGLIKKNTGTATISSANTYIGTTDVQQGTLIANYNTGTAQTVFATASTINVASGATFRAVANDSNFTLANNLTGTGLVVIDPHLTAAVAVRDVTISGNNAGFTGTLRLSPTTDVASGLGTFRTNTMTLANTGGATIDVDAGGQAWLAAGTFPNNFILTGHGFAEAAGGTPVAASGLTQYTGAVKGGIGAIRMTGGTIISGNITLDGSAKIMPYNATGTISGNISATNPTDTLVVGGGSAGSTLILTGTNNVGANAMTNVFVNSGGNAAGTNLLAIGANGTTGTLGTGSVTLNGDTSIGAIRFDRSDAYSLLAGNTITATGTTLANTFIEFDTQGTGFNSNGVAITLGTAAAGGTFRVGQNRPNTVTTISGALTGSQLSVGSGATGTGATLNLNSGANVSVANINIATAATGATVNIAPGATVSTTGNFFLGEQVGFAGTVNQTGGDVTVGSHVRVAHWSTNTSAYNISAGTLTIANINTVTDPSTAGATEQNGGIYLGVDGTGTMAQSGGTVTTDWIVLDNRGDTVTPAPGIDSYTLSGSGLLVLRSQWGITQRNASTAVTLAGGTIRNGGTNLQVRLDTAPDISGAVTLDTVSAGNSFNWTRNAAGAGSLALAGGGTLRFTNTTTQAVSVPLTGSGAVEKLGIGITTLSNTNTYDGTTTISAGTLQVGAANAIPSGSGKGNVAFSAAGTSSVLDLNGFDISINGLSQPASSSANLVVNNATGTNKTLTLGNNDASAIFAGVIANNTSGTGTLALTKVGTGTQTLGGASTFTGPINVNGGLIAFASSPATSGPLGNSTTVNLNGGGLSYTATGSNALNRSVVIGAGNGTLDVASAGGTLTVSSVASSGGNLVKTGPGLVQLTAASTTLNTGTSGVVVNGGTLQGGFGTGGIGSINVTSGGTLSFQNTVAEVLTLGGTGSLALNNGAALTFELAASGTNDSILYSTASTSGSITLNFLGLGGFGAGTYNLLNLNTGASNQLAGTSFVLGAAPIGYNYSITNNGTLVQLVTTAYTPIYWRGGVDSSWNTLGVGPANWTTDSAGSVDAISKPVAADTVIFSAANATGPAISTTLDAAFTIDSLQFGNAPLGVTSATVAPGTGGALTVKPTSASGGIAILTGGGNAIISAPVTADINGLNTVQTWNVADLSSTLDISGNVTFTANVNKTGVGALTLSGANTGAGNLSLNAGTLNLNSNGALGTGSLNIANGTTLNNSSAGVVALTGNGPININGDFTFTGGNNLNLGTGAVTLVGNPIITANANTLTLGGAVGGSSNLTKAGNGTLVLSGNSNYSGTTTISTGVLNIQNGNALGSTAAGTSVASGAALQIQGGINIGAESLALSGTGISSDGALRNISGNNTYAGLVTLGSATRINSDAGTLSLSNTGTITGATFGLTVGGAGNTTINSIIGTTSGGLTKDGIGTLTVTGTNTYTGATTVSNGTLIVSGTGTLGVPGAVATSIGTTAGSTGTLVINSSSATALNMGASSSSLIIGQNSTGTSAGVLYLAPGMSTTGTVTQASSGADINIGWANGATANVTGTIYQSAGTLNQTNTGRSFYLGLVTTAGGIGNGTYNIDGGTLNTAGSFDLGGTNGGVQATGTVSGVLNVSGTGLVTATGAFRPLRVSTSALTKSATVNLNSYGGNSGVLQTTAWTAAGAGNTTLSFNGGTLRMGATGSANYLAASTSAIDIYANGAIINTNGNSNTITQVFQNPANDAVTSVSVSGTSNTYTTPPTVTFSGVTGTAPTGYAHLDASGLIDGIVITNGGSFTGTPTVSISGESGLTYTPNTAANSTGGFTKLGAGTLTLSATNTFSGPVDIRGGVLSVTTLANGGLASGLGQSSNAASNVLLNGGILGYSGTAAGTTDRNFTLTTNGGGFDASGTVAGTFTVNTNIVVTGSSGAQTLTLQGTGTGAIGGGTITSVIANGTGTNVTSLAKLGTGSWTLGGSLANTYTGPTTVTGSGGTAGALILSKTGGALAIPGNITIGSGTASQAHVLFTENEQISPTATVTLNGVNSGWAYIQLQGKTQTFNNLVETTPGYGVIETREAQVGPFGTSNAIFNVASGTQTYQGYFRDRDTGAVDAANSLKLTKTGAGTLQWGTATGAGASGTSTTARNYSGGTDIQNGTLQLLPAFTSGNSISIVGAGNVSLNGGATFAGTLDLNGLNAGITGLDGTSGTVLGQVVNNLSATTAILSIGNNNNAGNFAGLIRDNTSGTGIVAITKLGTGIQVLSGVNTYSGATTVSAGTLSVVDLQNGGVNSNIGKSSNAASNLVFGTGTLQYTGGTTTIDRNFTINTGATATFDITQASTTLALPGATGAGTTGALVKSGLGALTLSGLNTYSGTTTVNAGTLTLSGGNSSALMSAVTVGSVGNTSILNITAGNYSVGGAGTRITVGNTGTGTVNQTGGAVTINGGSDELLVGTGTNGIGTYNLSAGSISQAGTASTTRGIMIGVNDGTTGTFNLSGTGSINLVTAQAALMVGRSDTALTTATSATYNQTGGTATVQTFTIGGNSTGGSPSVTSNFSVTGGTFNANTFTHLAGGASNTATLTIGGTGQVTLPAFPTARGAGSTATIIFDSGATGFLSPAAASATYMPAGTFTNAFLTANGANFNVPTGRDITIGQALINATSPAAAGTLTKSGIGVLTLTGANTYTGTTTVNDGTLVVTGSLANNSSLHVLMFAPDDSIAGNPVLTRSVGAVPNAFAGFGSRVTSASIESSTPPLSGIALQTTADILMSYGTNADADNLSMAWRMRQPAEASPSNVNAVLSDVVGITGMDNGLDIFVLQMSYNDAALGSLNEAAIATSGELRLGWNDGGTWKTATAGNTVVGSTFVGVTDWNTYYTGISAVDDGSDLNLFLGRYGVDPGNNKVWAVLDHNSEFAVIPEPSTLVLGGLALLGFAGMGLRRRRMSVK